MKDAIIALTIAAAVSAAAATSYADETLKEAGPPPAGAKKEMSLADRSGAQALEASAPLPVVRSSRSQPVGDAQQDVVTEAKARKQ